MQTKMERLLRELGEKLPQQPLLSDVERARLMARFHENANREYWLWRYGRIIQRHPALVALASAATILAGMAIFHLVGLERLRTTRVALSETEFPSLVFSGTSVEVGAEGELSDAVQAGAGTRLEIGSLTGDSEPHTYSIFYDGSHYEDLETGRGSRRVIDLHVPMGARELTIMVDGNQVLSRHIEPFELTAAR